MRKLKNERGQLIIEYAFALLLAVLLISALVQALSPVISLIITIFAGITAIQWLIVGILTIAITTSIFLVFRKIKRSKENIPYSRSHLPDVD